MILSTIILSKLFSNSFSFCSGVRLVLLCEFSDGLGFLFGEEAIPGF